MRTAFRPALAGLAAALLLAVPTATRAETYLALKGGVWVPTASEGWSAITASGSSIASGKLPTSGDIELAYGATLGIIGAQIGGFANFASATTPATGGNVSQSATKLSFLAIGGAGVDFILGPILLGAEARYMYITEQTFDWGNLKPSGVVITANVGYVF